MVSIRATATPRTGISSSVCASTVSRSRCCPDVVLHKRLHGANMTDESSDDHPMLRSMREKLERARAVQKGKLMDDLDRERLVTVVDHGLRRRALPRGGNRQRARSDARPARADRRSTTARPTAAARSRESYGSALRFLRQKTPVWARLGTARIELAEGRVLRDARRGRSIRPRQARAPAADPRRRTRGRHGVRAHDRVREPGDRRGCSRRCSEGTGARRAVAHAEPDAGSPRVVPPRRALLGPHCGSASASTGTPAPSTSGLKEAVPPSSCSSGGCTRRTTGSASAMHGTSISTSEAIARPSREQAASEGADPPRIRRARRDPRADGRETRARRLVLAELAARAPAARGAAGRGASRKRPGAR